MRSLVSITELTPDELARLVGRTVELAANGPAAASLTGRLVAICADNPAQLRCLAVWSAATRLGAQAVFCGPAGLPLGAETTGQSGQILGEYLDAVVVAVDAGIDEIFALYADEDLAVITAHSIEEQPIQAVADLATLSEHFGTLVGRHVLCVGAAAASLALAGALLPGVRVTVLGEQSSDAELTDALSIADAGVVRAGSLDEVDGPVDVIHAGGAELDPAFVARVCAPDAVLLHDRSPGGAACPYAVARGGRNGIRCLCDRQARHAMTAAMAVLEWCVVGF